MPQYDLEQHADYHATEAERLLARKLGVITNVVEAGVPATLAVYYATGAQRSS